VKGRGKVINGYVYGIEKIWDLVDTANYSEFVPVPYTRRDVRITRPEILYSLILGRLDATLRRTILL